MGLPWAEELPRAMDAAWMRHPLDAAELRLIRPQPSHHEQRNTTAADADLPLVRRRASLDEPSNAASAEGAGEPRLPPTMLPLGWEYPAGRFVQPAATPSASRPLVDRDVAAMRGRALVRCLCF